MDNITHLEHSHIEVHHDYLTIFDFDESMRPDKDLYLTQKTRKLTILLLKKCTKFLGLINLSGE